MRKRISLVIRLFAEAQNALSAMPLLFTLPLYTFTLLGMFLIYWLLTAFMIYSIGSDSGQLVIFGVNVNSKVVMNIIWIYHFVALIWISEFIFACQSMVIASSVAKWYFAR